MSSETRTARGETLRLWATIEYDGTDFYGFQVQAHDRTVQGELERALQAITGNWTRVIGAGRTDRGVHARGQVIGFQARWPHDLASLQGALNAVLAGDVVILAMGLAPEGFHPRYSALSRRYRYTILNQACRSPLARRTAWHVERELDVDQMNRASQCLIGSKDFGTFGRPPGENHGGSAVRRVLQARWQRQGLLLTFDIEANAFLYRMVRSIVGTLAQVGWGQISADNFSAMLVARDRSRVKRVAPAHGLCLMQVNYAAHEGVMQ
ncbi:MAG: tRNA pseudouridine(38-40) synthase TruA [Anaerolineae bacterium]